MLPKRYNYIRLSVNLNNAIIRESELGTTFIPIEFA